MYGWIHHQRSQYAIETLSLAEGKEICQVSKHKHMNLSSKTKDWKNELWEPSPSSMGYLIEIKIPKIMLQGELSSHLHNASRSEYNVLSHLMKQTHTRIWISSKIETLVRTWMLQSRKVYKTFLNFCTASTYRASI